jgi:hypothetical protein
MRKGSCILAAAVHLSVNDVHGAVKKLLRGDQLELAVALLLLLHLPNSKTGSGSCVRDSVVLALQFSFERRNQMDQAAVAALKLGASTHSLEQICAGFHGPAAAVPELYASARIGSVADYARLADDTERAGKTADAVQHLLLARQEQRAFALGIAAVDQCMRSAEHDCAMARSIIDKLSSIPIEKVEADARQKLLAYSYYLGALDAMWRGYTAIVPHLFSAAKKAISAGGSIPVLNDTLLLLEASYMATHNMRACTRLLSGLQSDAAKSAGQRLLLAGDRQPVLKSAALTDNSIVPEGDSLTSSVASHVRRRKLAGVGCRGYCLPRLSWVPSLAIVVHAWQTAPFRDAKHRWLPKHACARALLRRC